QFAREPPLIERMREEATAGNHRVNPGNHLLPYHDLLLRERADSMQTQRAYQTRRSLTTRPGTDRRFDASAVGMRRHRLRILSGTEAVRQRHRATIGGPDSIGQHRPQAVAIATKRSSATCSSWPSAPRRARACPRCASVASGVAYQMFTPSPI